MPPRLIFPALAAVLLALPAVAQEHGGHDAAPAAEAPSSEAFRAANARMHQDMDVELTGDADVDFARATAKTAYGSCGVKVWVFKGEIMAHDPMAQDKRLAEQTQGHQGHQGGRQG